MGQPVRSNPVQPNLNLGPCPPRSSNVLTLVLKLSGVHAPIYSPVPGVAPLPAQKIALIPNPPHTAQDQDRAGAGCQGAEAAQAQPAGEPCSPLSPLMDILTGGRPSPMYRVARAGVSCPSLPQRIVEGRGGDSLHFTPYLLRHSCTASPPPRTHTTRAEVHPRLLQRHLGGTGGDGQDDSAWTQAPTAGAGN